MSKSSYLFLYFDEDVSIKIAFNLRNRGFDVLTTLEAKRLGATDEEQLAYAVRNRRVLVTHNIRDFSKIHTRYLSSGKSHTGIVLAVRHRDLNRTVVRLLTLIQNTSLEEIQNQVRYL